MVFCVQDDRPTKDSKCTYCVLSDRTCRAGQEQEMDQRIGTVSQVYLLFRFLNHKGSEG